MILLNFLRDNDEFGQEANFNIAKKQKFQTSFGGLLYCSIVVLFLYKFSLELKNYIQKSNPIATISEKISDEPVEFEKDERIISLRGFDTTIKQGGFYNRTYDLFQYFDIIGKKITWEGTKPPNKTNLEVRKCDKKDHYSEDGIRQKIDSSICVFTPKNTSITIHGDWGENTTYIFIRFRFCNPKNNKNCLGKEKFFEHLDNSENNNYIETRLIDNLYNPENYENPLKEHWKHNYLTNSKNILNTLTFEFKKNEVDTDIGGSFEIVKSLYKREIHSISNSFVFSDNITDKTDYARLIIKGLPIKKTYSRVYPFIAEWIENATLFISWICILLQFIYSFYNNYKYKWFIFKTIVNYEDEDNPPKIIKDLDLNEFERKKNLSSESNLKKIKEMKDDKSDISSFSEENKNEKNLELIEMDKDYNKRNSENNEEIIENNTPSLNKELIPIDSKMIFDSLTKSNKKKNSNYLKFVLSIAKFKKGKLFTLFEKVCNNVEKKFDVFYYLKKIKNIKLLKKLLLEEHTHKLLNLISNKLYSSSIINENNVNKKKKLDADEFSKIINSIDDNNEMNKKLRDELFDKIQFN